MAIRHVHQRADSQRSGDLLQELIGAPPLRGAVRLTAATQRATALLVDSRNTRDLLQDLLETTPAPAGRQKAVALRSAREQQRYALRGYARRTWVDRTLQYAEQALLLAALLVFGYWFVDGPARDWLHARQDSAASAPLAAAIAPPAAPMARAPVRHGRAEDIAPAVLLPYTTSDMARPLPAELAPPVEDFMAPRQRPIDAPVVVAPQPSHLTIPAIGVDTPVKEVFIVDGAWQVADYAAGYLHGTGMPGDPGNTVLAGHAGLRGAVFRDIGALKPDDDIYLDAAGWRYHYRVRESKRVWPDQVEVLDQTPTAVLTMMTCTNWDTQRLVVVADLVDSKPSPGP